MQKHISHTDESTCIQKDTADSNTPPLVPRASALSVCSVRVIVPLQADHCSLKHLDGEQPNTLQSSESVIRLKNLRE